MAWTKFEISRLNYNVCNVLIIVSLIQNAIYYYLMYEYSAFGSQWFFSFSLFTLIFTKLIWLIGLEYQIIKYTPAGPHHYWSMFLVDFLPLVLFKYRHVWSMTFRRYFYGSISHAFLVGIPMAILNNVYLINYSLTAPFTMSLISIFLTSMSVPLVFVGHGGCIPTKANAFHLICLLLDTFKGLLTIWFITNWIFYNRYEYDGPFKSFWTMDVVNTATFIFVIKTCIFSPFYAVFLFVFHGFHSVPNCSLNSLLLFLLIPIALIFIWLFVDTIFFSYPLLIFYHNAYEYQFDLWFNVIRFLHEKVNKYDYSLRLWLFNYLWLIQRIFDEEEDAQNPIYTPVAAKHRKSDDSDDECNEFEFKSNDSNEIKISNQNMKYFDLLQKVEQTLIWYLTPNNEQQNKSQSEKYANLTPKQGEKQKKDDFECRWNEKFDLNLFVTSGDKMSIVLYEGYDGLMRDVLMKFFDLGAIVGTADYDKVNLNIDNEDEYQCFNLFRKIIEMMFIYFIAPTQVLLAIYGAIIYPVFVSVVVGVNYADCSGDVRGLFWFMWSYYTVIIVMLLFLPSFLEMVRCLWYSLYSRAGNWQEEPDKYLNEAYNYIHLNRQRIDVIQQRFGNESGENEIHLIVFQYLGYKSYNNENQNDNYILPNALSLFDIITSSDDEESDYYKLINSSVQILDDNEKKNEMILSIQQRQHV